jgi:hypothetical protein
MQKPVELGLSKGFICHKPLIVFTQRNWIAHGRR